jgi:hypothetical protein
MKCINRTSLSFVPDREQSAECDHSSDHDKTQQQIIHSSILLCNSALLSFWRSHGSPQVVDPLELKRKLPTAMKRATLQEAAK